MRTRRKLGLRPLSARYAYFRGINYDRAAARGFYAQGANILSYRHGWSWIAHLGGDVTSIGIVSDNWEGGFFERLKHLPKAEAFGIAHAKVVDFRGAAADPETHYIHPAYSYESAVAYGRNWCAVGDAARFLDPLLSQGVTMAIAFGGLAGTYAGEMLTGERGEEPSPEEWMAAARATS